MPLGFGSFSGSNSFARIALGSKLYQIQNLIAYGSVPGEGTITGNGTDTTSFFKTSGSASWGRTAVRDTTPYTAPVTVEFYKNATSTGYAMISWNTDPLTNASYTDLDYAPYIYTSGSVRHYNGASSLGDTSLAHNTTKKFYLVYATDGYQYLYWGSTMVRSFNRGTGLTVYLDSALYTVSAVVGGYSEVRIAKKAWNGTDYV